MSPTSGSVLVKVPTGVPDGWFSAMVDAESERSVGAPLAAIVKSAVKSKAIVSGGSRVSTSWILVAVIVRWQTVATGSMASGVRVQTAVPDPLSEKVLGVPVGHARAKAPASAFTGSLKVTLMVEPAATFVAPPAGEVETTDGAVSTVLKPIVTSPVIVSGGSPASTSCTSPATTLRLHVAEPGRSLVGVRVTAVLVPPRAKGTAMLLHVRTKEAWLTVTGSVKVTVSTLPAGTLVAVSSGSVESTAGGLSTVKEKL